MYENPTFDFHNQNINHDKNKETKDQKRLLTTRSLDGVGEGVRGEGGIAAAEPVPPGPSLQGLWNSFFLLPHRRLCS